MQLSLRKIRKEQLEMIMKWRIKPNITCNLYTDPVLTLEIQKKWFKKINNDSSLRYWIIHYEDTPIGLLWLYGIDQVNKRCEWGYFIGEDDFRGRGLARTLECNIYDYVFNVMNLNKLHCEVFAFNEKVVSIHKKFGSDIEGVLKQHIYKQGKFFDIVCMGIIAEKWKNIKCNYQYEKIYIEE